MGKRPAPDPDNCLGGSFPPLVNCAVGAHYEISFVLLLGERSRFSRILKKLLISSARCLSQAECRPEITRLASNIRSGSPLDFLFAQEDVQCCGNRVGALAESFG